MLVNRDTLRGHAPWMILAAAVCLLSTAWYVMEARAARAWLGGSSRPGFILGIFAGLLCLFEFLLWPRKRLRAWRLGRAKYWMRAHIWFGLLIAPLVALHCGFRLGGSLSTILTVLVMTAIVSGVWGLYLQNRLPRFMLEQLPAETIYSQIDHVSRQYALDAAHLVARVCGQLPQCLEDDPHQPPPGEQPVVVGAVRSRGSFRGKVVHATAVPQAVKNSGGLLRAFDQFIYPYLIGGAAGQPLFEQRGVSSSWFSTLRDSVDVAARATIDELETLCEQRRQFDQQRQLHRQLHNWITVHLAVSVALLVLLIAHVVGALRYW